MMMMMMMMMIMVVVVVTDDNRWLKHARFEKRTATGREHFACQDSGVSQISKLIISNGEKILSNVNVIV